MGLYPLDAEGDRSMFSAGAFLAKHVFPPKNGPVPDQPVKGYLPVVAATYLRPKQTRHISSVCGYPPTKRSTSLTMF